MEKKKISLFLNKNKHLQEISCTPESSEGYGFVVFELVAGGTFPEIFTSLNNDKLFEFDTEDQMMEFISKKREFFELAAEDYKGTLFVFKNKKDEVFIVEADRVWILGKVQLFLTATSLLSVRSKCSHRCGDGRKVLIFYKN